VVPMFKVGILTVAFLGLILTAGVSPNSSESADQNSQIRTVITSSPAGARVTYRAFGKERDLGKTPFTWSFLASDLNRSSMVPTLTFYLPSHATLNLPLTRSKKIHARLIKSVPATRP
jgi:hypothetical protein